MIEPAKPSDTDRSEGYAVLSDEGTGYFATGLIKLKDVVTRGMYFAHVTSAGVVDYEYAPFKAVFVGSEEKIKYLSIGKIVQGGSSYVFLYGCGICSSCNNNNDKAILSLFKTSHPSLATSLNAK